MLPSSIILMVATNRTKKQVARKPGHAQRMHDFHDISPLFFFFLKTKALISNMANLALLLHSCFNLLAPLLRFLLAGRMATTANFTFQ